jgi:hypothetical protein
MRVMRLVHSVSIARPNSHRERVMPKVIAVGTRSPATWLVRLAELLFARVGWLTGRVPAGVTPTLSTSRRWR